MLVRNSGAAVGYLLFACRYAQDPFHRKGLRGAVGIGPRNMRKELTPLSSVAYGATPFLRKGALVLRHAAVETKEEIP